jgi:hypothetical protein
MISWSARQSSALRAALASGCAFVFWNGSARAQSAALEPDLWPISPNPSQGPLPSRDKPSSESNESSTSRTDHLRIGALVGVGFPRPLAIEGIVKLERTLALGLEYSALPQISVSDVQVSAWAIAGSARVFPFRGPFFVGLRAGRQHLNAQASVSGYGYTVPVSLGVDTTFLNPQIGFLWTWDPGFSIGIDAGLQIPLTSSTASSVDASMPSAVQQYVSPLQNTMESVAGTVGQTVLPTIDLVRIGVLF